MNSFTMSTTKLTMCIQLKVSKENIKFSQKKDNDSVFSKGKKNWPKENIQQLTYSLIDPNPTIKNANSV